MFLSGADLGEGIWETRQNWGEGWDVLRRGGKRELWAWNQSWASGTWSRFAVTEPTRTGRLRDRTGEQDGRQAWEDRGRGQGGWAGEGKMSGRMKGQAWKRELG